MTDWSVGVIIDMEDWASAVWFWELRSTFALTNWEMRELLEREIFVRTRIYGGVGCFC